MKPPGKREEFVQTLELVTKVATAAYTLMMMWQVAKMMNPKLQLQQDMAVAAVKKKFAALRNELPELTNDDRAELYDFLRG